MRKLSLIVLASAGLAAGCTAPGGQTADVSPAVDTGSMAYPTPRPSGEFQRSPLVGRDTGSMTYPDLRRPGYTTTPSGTNSPAADTGSMAYPTPRPSGVLPSTNY